MPLENAPIKNVFVVFTPPLIHLDHFFLFERQFIYLASKEKYSFENRKP